MLYVIITLIVLAASFFPQFWVRYTMRKYGGSLDDLPGTGGELAKHLIDRYQLTGTNLEKSQEGQDHYDPISNTVRLSPSNYDTKSLTAVAIAAHEVGHAIQFNRKETISQLRGKYIPLSLQFKKIGAVMLLVMPIAVLILKAPIAIGIFIGVSLLFQLIGVFMYLIVLPEEWDASFNKALPILIEGEYLPDNQLNAVSKVLKAAALTYFASALAEALNIGRWIMVLLRR